MAESQRIFLLSPAHCGGKRAGFLLNESATFDLAKRIRTAPGIPLGEVFSFLSGLYFRGKIAYSNAFASPPAGLNGSYVITTNRGLVPPETLINVSDLRDLGCSDINAMDLRYREPVERDLKQLAMNTDCQFVLLGSVATGKYVDVLLHILGKRLLFPRDFVGRGDMSRGGLMLRSAAEGKELTYIPVLGATLHGTRPTKLSRSKK